MNINNDTRASRDKELFNKITSRYALKDSIRSTRVVREWIILSSLELVDSNNVKKIIEIGCGIAAPYEYIKKYREIDSYIGLDHSEEMICSAKNIYSDDDRINFVCTDASEYREYDDADLIISIGVLHHVEKIDLLLSNIFKRLKTGAQIIVIEPNDSNLLIRLLRKVRKKVDSSYSAEQVFFKPDELLKHIENAGFKNIRYTFKGYFSSPLGEVILKPIWLFYRLSRLAILFDKLIESYCPKSVKKQSWAIAVVATK